MKEIRYTLLTDGVSDKVLITILSWLLHEHCPGYAVQSAWADLGRLPRPPKKLPERIRTSVELYPCDLLFVHRDAEKISREARANEIRQALSETEHPPAVCVVPVRMTEAWLLFDEMSIRKAAGNPNGNQPLELPIMNDIESLPDPKQNLYNLLCLAKGHINKRRLKSLSPNRLAFRVTESTRSFAPLRELAAFRNLEKELLVIISALNWNA
ncbi:MAG: hypothetical protein E4H46_03330 [Desulfobacterales bacterium]|nr:MAG: hypothetical protein E4H46_03330 [Desulfobacterales bacterium]